MVDNYHWLFFVYMILDNDLLNKILICEYINKAGDSGYNCDVNVLINFLLERW